MGGTGDYKTIHDMEVSSWDHTIRLNLYSPFIVTNAFLPVMRKQEYGRIVSITSQVANEFYEGLGAYSAAKAGLEGLMCKDAKTVIGDLVGVKYLKRFGVGYIGLLSVMTVVRNIK